MQNKELIEYSMNEEMKYRLLLPIDEKFVFGIEIEMEEIDYNNAERLIKNKVDDFWEIKDDGSLQYGGLEIASPTLTNKKETWKLLLKLSKTLQYINPTFQNASFQVNLDVPFHKDKMLSFLKFFSCYEDIIFRFSRGIDSHVRSSALVYASPITPELIHMNLDENYCERIIRARFNRKKYAIRLKLDKNYLMNNIETINKNLDNLPTIPISIIEFRTPNGTVDCMLWQNYINMFYHLLQYINTLKVDCEKLEYQFLHTTYRNCIEDYEILHIEKAIEFANLIFKEDIDKVYFLKQYIGTDCHKIKMK